MVVKIFSIGLVDQMLVNETLSVGSQSIIEHGSGPRMHFGDSQFDGMDRLLQTTLKSIAG